MEVFAPCLLCCPSDSLNYTHYGPDAQDRALKLKIFPDEAQSISALKA